MPCQHRYAYTECRIAALEAALQRYMDLSRGDDHFAEAFRIARAALTPAPAPEPAGAMLSSARTIVAEEINMPPDSAALARVTRAIRETGGCGHASDDYTRCDVRDHCICEREALAAIEAMAATPKEPRP